MATIDVGANLEAVPAAAPVAVRRYVPAREVAAVAGLVALADVTIFRGYGYAGMSLLFLAAPLLLLLGHSGSFARRGWLITGLMLVLVGLRGLWLGSILNTLFGLTLVVAFSMTLHGWRPYVLELVVYALHLAAAGWVGATHYVEAIAQRGPRLPRGLGLSVGLPLVALGVFGAIFVLANPHLVTAFTAGGDRLLQWLAEQITRIDINGGEIVFCVVAAGLSIGLLRPLWGRLAQSELFAQQATKQVTTQQDCAIFGALRNTLVAVNVLFAVYLVYEFATLWFREFPQGFHYSGYAHQGAAWLTVALALATLALSMIFRGETLRDQRLGSLKRLAWIWSVENLVLAATVYNRMQIYVDFNGMTRMRVIGLFGITSVVVGFALVLWKIRARHDFVWLIRRQLWTVALAAYLFALTPVDWLVHQYNVRQILAGDPAPSVQISVHPISSEGMLVLPRLVECEDSTIRAGICAMLAQEAQEVEGRLDDQSVAGWTALQLADRALWGELQESRAAWEPYLDPQRRAQALQRFHAYAYRWY